MIIITQYYRTSPQVTYILITAIRRDIYYQRHTHEAITDTLTLK